MQLRSRRLASNWLQLAAPSVLIAVLAARAPAQSCGATVETDFQSSFVGGWSWGGPSQSTVSGPVPRGPYLRSDGLDTFAPQLRTSGGSPFTGDYRAQGVTALGCDLQTFALDFPSSCQRPLSLVLANNNGTPANFQDDTFVYTLLPGTIPCVDGLWHSYSAPVPSQSATLPPGWSVDPNWTGPTAQAWNRVITNVTQATWFYGDPSMLFIFQMWSIGADNLRIAFDGGASAYCVSQRNSAGCQPEIWASGTPSLSSPQAFELLCRGVVNQKSGLLFYGLAPQPAPFVAGPLCVAPPLKRTALQFSGGSPSGSDCSGSFAFDLNGWLRAGADPALQPGVALFAQYWSRDPAASSGNVNFSNALALRVCP